MPIDSTFDDFTDEIMDNEQDYYESESQTGIDATAFGPPEADGQFHRDLVDERLIGGASDKEALREGYESDMEAYLAKGGVVTVIPAGARATVMEPLSAGRGRQGGRRRLAPGPGRHEGVAR